MCEFSPEILKKIMKNFLKNCSLDTNSTKSITNLWKEANNYYKCLKVRGGRSGRRHLEVNRGNTKWSLPEQSPRDFKHFQKLFKAIESLSTFCIHLISSEQFFLHYLFFKIYFRISAVFLVCLNIMAQNIIPKYQNLFRLQYRNII